MLFAAENRVRYLRPIKPLERYVILTTCTTVDDSSSSKLSSSSSKKNDKWLYYRHVFQQHPDDVVRTNNNNDDDEEEKEDIAPLTYAIIDLKAVVKQKNGVTIKPSVLMEESRFYREWYLLLLLLRRRSMPIAREEFEEADMNVGMDGE